MSFSIRLLFCLVPVLLAGTSRGATPDEILVARYLKYRELTRLTEEQIDMVESTRMSCADPRWIHGPHLQPGIHLYASPGAIEARKNDSPTRRYPVGTLLVKEKFEEKGGGTPGIITVMEKVADTGKVDDWQFHMIRIADRTIVRDGFKVSCVDCHSRYTETNFVSRQTDRLLGERAKK